MTALKHRAHRNMLAGVMFLCLSASAQASGYWISGELSNSDGTPYDPGTQGGATIFLTNDMGNTYCSAPLDQGGMFDITCDAYPSGGIHLKVEANNQSYPPQYFNAYGNTAYASYPLLMRPEDAVFISVFLNTVPPSNPDTCGSIQLGGIVLDEYGSPLAIPPTVHLVNSAAEILQQGQAATSGEFFLQLSADCGPVFLRVAGNNEYPTQYFVLPRNTSFPHTPIPYDQDIQNVTVLLDPVPVGSSTGSNTAVVGHIADPAGYPVQGARAVLHLGQTMTPVDSAWTDEYGDFVLDAFPPDSNLYLMIRPNTLGIGDQWWSAAGPTASPCAALSVAPGSVFHLLHRSSLNPSSTCGGMIYPAGAVRGFAAGSYGGALEGVEVTAYRDDGTGWEVKDTTNRDGEFILYNLHAETNYGYQIRFRDTFDPDAPDLWWGPSGTTESAQNSLALQAWQTLFLGNVYLEGQSGADSSLLFDAVMIVYLLDPAGDPVWPDADIELETSDGQYYAGTAVNGHYEWHVPENYYAIWAMSSEFPGQFYSADGSTAWPDEYVHVASGDTTEVYFRLSSQVDSSGSTYVPPDSGSGKISGAVRNAAGTGIPGVRVMAIDDSRQWIDDCDPHDNWSYYAGFTDQKGAYVIQGLPDGNYAVIAVADSQNLVAQYYPGTEEGHERQEVAVTGGDVRDIDFTLTPGAVARGYVKNAGGQPLSGIEVRLEAQDMCREYRAHTDANGKYTIAGIAPDEYRIDAGDHNDTYFLDEDPGTVSFTRGQIKTMPDIVMVLGGWFTGQLSVSTSADSFLGLLFLYPADSSNTDHDHVVYPEHVVPMMSFGGGSFGTDRCPPGKWRLVLSPLPPHLFDQSNTSDLTTYSRGKGWSYVGPDATFASAGGYAVYPSRKTVLPDMSYVTGYTVYGRIMAEGGEPMGTSSDNAGTYDQMSYKVYAFVEQDDYYVMIAVSHDLGGGRFELPGLMQDEEYFLQIEPHGRYPMQWWSPEMNTAGPRDAYRFSTSSFSSLDIRVVYAPEGGDSSHYYDDYDSNRPSAVQNVTVVPVGFTSFLVSWDAAPKDENVVKYQVWRINDPQESDFEIVDGSWRAKDEDAFFAGLDSFETTDTFFVDSTVTPNTSYVYVVSAIDSAGRESRMEETPGSIPFEDLLHRISYSSFRTRVPVTPARWQMIGSCGLDSIPVLPAPDRVLYTWDDKRDQSKLYAHYLEARELRATRGYWIYSATSLTPTMSPQAFDDLSAKTSVKVALKNGHTGWNQISSPFPFAVRPGWLGPDFVAFEWVAESNMYRKADQLDPWKAYWVHNHTGKDTTLKIPARPAAFEDKALAKSRFRPGWELTVSLEAASSADPDNVLGVVPAALGKRHLQKTPEPPRAFAFAQAYFLSEGQKLSAHYMVSPAIPTRKLEWTVAVAPSTEAATLRMSGIERVPPEVGVYWVDNNGAIDLRQHGSIAVTPHEKTRYGYVVATANPADMALYGGRFDLRPNYPNPFAGATTIEFVIPYAWNADGSRDAGSTRHASLVIYDLAGRQVADLMSGPLAVGMHRTVWDGTGSSGKPVPSGFYIARLRSGTSARSIRLFRLR
ncbi:MAG: hypothetical protein GF418_02815 [Chitinivibrionales bacterium]|nr:hypothetical protein [Chitinivibrionales bacterium]MBD3394534.1 hypothetical protein [Chitinivibrionales bacterium]